MQRIVTLDTETTGLDWKRGDRVIEIGAVEIVGRQLTGRHFHEFLNPEREIDAGAIAVHGITAEVLADKPKFAEVAPALLDFLRDAVVVIHNASFDLGFLNAELRRVGLEITVETVAAEIVDTLKLAKTNDPTKRASLDALCERYGIDNQHRTLHGALLDAELLAEVYLAMTRGQESLLIDAIGDAQGAPSIATQWQRPATLVLAKVTVAPDELAAHEAILDEIDKASNGQTVWRAQLTPVVPAS